MKHYFNLTNGLEFLGEIVPDGFVRIQSSHCEAKSWSKIIEDLDYTFLLHCALYPIVVYDASSKKKIPRALYQGIPFIEYVMNRRWHGVNAIAKVKGMNVTPYFSKEYERLTDRAKQKLDYVSRIVNPRKVSIQIMYKGTKNDGDYVYYKGLTVLI